MQIRLREPHRQRAVLVSVSGQEVALLEALLLERGVVVSERIETAIDLTERHTAQPADLVVIYVGDQAEAGLKASAEISSKLDIPLLAVTIAGDPELTTALIEHGAHSVLSIGVSVDRLAQALAGAVATHEQISGHRHAAERARQELEGRKLIERAKGILMESRGLTERDAFRHLQQTSMDRNEGLAEVARTVIAAKELLG